MCAAGIGVDSNGFVAYVLGVMRFLVVLMALVFASSCVVVAHPHRHRVASLREVTFVAQPHLVVVSPGVYVVADYPVEVFFHGGFYWVWWESGWYRSSGFRTRWVLIESLAVPLAVTRLPRGKYKHYRAATKDGNKHGRSQYGSHPGQGHGKGGKKKGKKKGKKR